MDKQHLIIKDVRCSFPQLYGSEVKNGKTFNPGITVILERKKHAEIIKAIQSRMKSAIAGNQKLTAKPPKADNICLRRPEADQEELLYKPDNLILKAGNPRAPVVLEPDSKTLMTEETDKIYSGCYVNIKVDIWGQANDFGRRVNAKLLAVQYIPKAADSFDGSYVSPEEAMDGFDSLDDDVAIDDLNIDVAAGIEDEDNLLG